MAGVFNAVLQLQPPLDRVAAGPNEAHGVAGLRAQLALQFFVGRRTGSDIELLVDHAQRHHMVGMCCAQGQDAKRIALDIKAQHLDLHHAGHAGQRALQLVVRQQQAHHQFGRPGTQQIGALFGQGRQRGLVQHAQLQQGVAQGDDGLVMLRFQRSHQQRQAVHHLTRGPTKGTECVGGEGRRGHRHQGFLGWLLGWIALQDSK
ncbi:hypothetical protein Y695_04301 [Hydrogenophaga sp. T4]|nr:hypothetical protein Y695_04301 [Hydrogenophaga sp. T4]